MAESASPSSRRAGSATVSARWPRAGWVVARTLLVVLALEVVYLVAANAVLAFGGVKKLVESSDDLHVEYRTAWSLWPGHVEVRDFSLRAEDHNVEFLVGVRTASLDIAISDLFRRRFHATSVETTGTVYRMRHHVESVGSKAARLAAYPSIEGFPDPPLYREPDQPGPSDEDYDLWEIQLEDVVAEIAEIWILEYRYLGEGTATGRFHLRPARWFEVGPASLSLRAGRLTVDDRPASERMTGRIDCYAERTDVQKLTGLAVLGRLSAGVHLLLEGTDLAFANVYTRPALGAHLSGHGSGRIDLEMKNAMLVPGGTLEFAARPFDVRKGKVHFGGPLDFALRVGPRGAEGGLVAEVHSKELIGAIRDKETPSPSVRGLLARAFVEPRDIRGDFAMKRAELDVGRLRAPSLAWFNALFEGGAPRLAGSATLAGHLAHEKGRGLDADVEADFESLRVEVADTWFRAGGGDVDLALRSAPEGGERLDVKELAVRVQDLTVKKGDGHTAPVTATVLGEGVQVRDLSPFSASGVLRAHGGPASALLPLFIEPALLRTVAGVALGRGDVDARVAFRTSPSAQRLELLSVRSGNLHARGLLQRKPPEDPEGAILVSAGALNVGVKLKDAKTDVKPFASDEWLPAELAKLAAPESTRNERLTR